MKNPGKVSQFILLLSLLVSQVSDKDFSITINAYFNVKWRDPRLLVSKDYSKEGRHPEVFLDALASLAFNLSVSESVMFFG